MHIPLDWTIWMDLGVDPAIFFWDRDVKPTTVLFYSTLSGSHWGIAVNLRSLDPNLFHSRLWSSYSPIPYDGQVYLAGLDARIWSMARDKLRNLPTWGMSHTPRKTAELGGCFVKIIEIQICGYSRILSSNIVLIPFKANHTYHSASSIRLSMPLQIAWVGVNMNITGEQCFKSLQNDIPQRYLLPADRVNNLVITSHTPGLENQYI